MIWRVLDYREIMINTNEPSVGQSPIHPTKHTSLKVLLAQVTDILPQERYSYGPLVWQMGLVCGVRCYKRRMSLVLPDPQAIVTMISQNLQSVQSTLLKGPALATHSCTNKIGSNSNSYGLS